MREGAHPIREVEPGGPAQILITALYQDDTGWIHMEYEYQGTLLSVNYREVDELCFEYEFVDNVATGAVSATETYCRSKECNAPPRNDGDPPPRNDGDPPPTPDS